MKRFYKLVTVEKAPEGFEIRLDGKPVRTPAGQRLPVPVRGVAEAVMREWAEQKTDIIPDRMPLTQLLVTACDRISRERPAITEAVLGYLDTDLLCYRAAHPAGMGEAQAAAWDPWLEWFAARHGARLASTADINALTQPDAAHEAVRRFVDGLDDLRFAALQAVVPLCGSLVLGLAFIEGAADPDAVFAAAHIEESFKARIYNEALYGPDPQEQERRDRFRRDLDAAWLLVKEL